MLRIYRKIADGVEQSLIELPCTVRLVIIGLQDSPHILETGVNEVFFVNHGAKISQRTAKSCQSYC